MGRGKTRKSMEDSDDDNPIFLKGWEPKKTPKIPVHDDDDDPMFPKGWEPKKTPKIPVPKVKRVWRKKQLPHPTRLDKATHMIQAGATEVNLIRLDLEANMDAKLASLIMDVATQRHVVSLELQAIFSSYVAYRS
jgi:hypothetical protein